MLRKTIKQEASAQGVSYYRLAKVAKMQQTQLKKYLAGEQDTTGENIERMLVYLGIRLCK